MNIYDIAKLANVSIATVSRVVNNSPKVSPKTKENLNDPDIKLKTKKNANGTETIQKAELSNDEKQTIILKQMKRLLGESQ